MQYLETGLSDMIIRIDYLTYTEQVNIANDSSDKAAWKALYGFICDYLPISVLSYSDWSITFPWRYFLSIKGYIGQYFLAHRNQYKVIFSENAKARLKTANDTSYNAAISQSCRSESDILKRLSSVGFKRHLTNNQTCNLSKISHLPGAATFSVPGAGKTTEALAFFFLNATDADRSTKLVGETDFDQDFYIQCKIIKNKYESVDERLEFIANVAEATNTQKPIKDKDLIANRIEQRLLKRQLADAGIYCQIKRGEKVNKKLYPAAWQNTTNEELGQFLLSFVYQKPGTARGSKASICGNKERYHLLFSKKYNSGLLSDLLKIKAFYKLWASRVKKTDDGTDPYKVGLVNNGMFFMTAIIGIVCKIYYRPNVINQITTSVMSEQKLEVVAQHDIDHPIFRLDLEKKEQFFTLFEYCYTKFYRPGYEFLKTFKEKYNNYSNFTKINNNYTTYVFKQIEFEYRHGIPDNDMNLLDSILYKASDEDFLRNKALLEKYVNVVYVDAASESNVPESVSAEIKERLIAYRTKTYKLNRIKAYEVFKNVSCDRIAKFAPTSLEDLKALRCLDEAQITLYGQDIIEIVSQVLNR